MNSTTLYADVILPIPLAQLFTYNIPSELNGEVAIGKRVVVPFGSKKLYTAIVKDIHENAPADYETKPVLSILDSFPIIDRIQFQFWEWISQYYQCTIGEVYKAALPSGMKLESQTRILLNTEFVAHGRLSASEEQILNILSHSKDASIQDLNQITKLKNTLPQVKSLLDKGAIIVEEQLQKSYREKTQKIVNLNPQITESLLSETLDQLGRAKKQQEVLMCYLNLSKCFIEPTPHKVKLTELLKSSGTSHSIVNSLVKKNILEISEEKIDRLDFTEIKAGQAHPLNPHQSTAYKHIIQQFEEKNCVLLHGVTSSGKTEIYIHLIRKYIEAGQQVLYLLPEIALTTQIIHRLQRVFGNKVGVYHSKFNDAERVEIWNNIHQNDPNKTYQVVLGVRSSIFLPFHNLGLIIIDEEHENTYKQFDPAPRYHARDAALVLAQKHGAKTLLGTATPAIESYYNARKGKYGLVELTQRYQNIQLPEILIANTREARRKKIMKSIFTPMLYDHIREALEMNEQVILFQNRRGFAPYIECKECGWVPHCENCDVSLTYHRFNNKLECHYCGYSTYPPNGCSQCESTSLEDRGYGTEKIEEELLGLFPEAKIGRMDLDTTRSKRAYEKIIASFEQKKLDILIGTQMVSKGLDFDNVSVVGIMNADNMLNYPDFRAYERSYQLMAQVAGRAGRKHKQGKVIIQTNDPKHPIIKDVLRNNYLNMYKMQMEEREEYIYPPFYRMISITLKHKDQRKLNQAGLQFGSALRKIFGIRIFGPQAPLINRIQNFYLLKIILKIESKSSPAKAKWILNREANTIKSKAEFKSLQIHFDVDPL
ncbi:MAG: primosomal protein N' [Marinifilaceae bacterium]